MKEIFHLHRCKGPVRRCHLDLPGKIVAFDDPGTVRRPGGGVLEFLKWTLTDVTVASYQTASNVPSDEPPMDQVRVRFAKIEVEYRLTKPDGSLDVPINAGWDLQANKSI